MSSTSKKSPSTPPKLDKEAYERELKRLQAELVEMQQWVVETGARMVIIMEGRDAAGKGSAIKRITQYLNPRSCRIEALPKPCLLYTSPSPRDATLSRMPSSA